MGLTPRLEVRVVVANHGDEAAAPLVVVGELLGEQRQARVVGGVAPGQDAAVVLDFPVSPPRPGRHVLTLLLEYPVGGVPDAGGNRPVESQRAYLLLALGANPEPAVQLDPGPASIDIKGELPVRLESADGEAHRMLLRVVTARGLRAPSPPIEVEVPATGSVTVAVPLARAGASRGTRHGALVVAETIDGPLARTSVGVATVEVAPDPALLPRLRGPLLILALALLALAALAEARRRRQERAPGSD